MTVNLTNNAIPMICEGGFEGNEFKPIVQIADLKLLSSQQSTSDRYRLLLSDGTHTQQGMLATQMNNLVSSGKLQKGSVVQLLEFVSQTIQNRKIIIIISLNVILEKCDPIGQPKQFVQGAAGSAPQAQPQMEQPGMAAGNHQQSYSADASVPSGPSPNRNVNGRAQLNQTNSDNISYPQSSVGSIPNNSNTGGYVSTGPRFQGAAPLSGNYGDQNRNQNNVKTSGSQVPFNSHPVRPVQPVYKPPPVYMNRGPIAKNEAPAREIPIRALNPYQGRWTIKARVTLKSELRTYTNARGAGKVFSFDLLDAEGGEIQVTCFNAVADQFYSQIEAGKVYMLSNGMLKPASKSFNHLNNEYEIYLENSSRVQLCVEDDNNIKRQQFRFRPISEIESMQNNSFVDVIGVVSSVNLTTPIMKKDGTETLKKTLQLKDMSGRSVELTLWGSFCNAEGQQLQNMVDSGVYPVVAVKAGRISEFNGKSVGTLPSSQLFIEPDFLEAHELKAWFEAEGNNTPSVSISRESSGMGRTVRKLISQIKDERLGTSEKPDWITVSARISFVKTENFVYTACPLMVGDRQCNKKVINNGDGQWRCDRCDKSVPQCDFRYILQLQIQDFTGIAYVTAFQESGEEIMGISAKDLYHLKEEDDEKFMDIIRSIVFNPYIFKLKVKEEIYNDEQRVKCTVVKAEKLNFSSESKILLDLMNKFGLEDTTGAGTSNKVEHQNAGLRQSTPAAMNSTGSRNNYGKDMGAPANQTAQYGNTYSSTNNPSMASTGVYLSCNSCGGTGHNSRNCPGTVKREAQSNGGGGQGGYANRPQSLGAAGGGGYGGGGHGGGTGGGVSGECYKCHKSGHWARDCPGTNSTSSVYGGGNGQTGRYGGISNERVGGF